jgi:hypothetical protein
LIQPGRPIIAAPNGSRPAGTSAGSFINIPKVYPPHAWFTSPLSGVPLESSFGQIYFGLSLENAIFAFTPGASQPLEGERQGLVNSEGKYGKIGQI